MQVEKHKVVTFDYTMANDRGEILETTRESGPVLYIHGLGELLPALEQSLAGKSPGEKFQLVLPPERAYGMRDDSPLKTLSRGEFDDIEDLAVGMQLEIERDDDGQWDTVTIVDIDDESVTLDTQHPLAGETLHFDVEVLDVRDITDEELAHGHVHGPGGHED